MLGDGPAFGDVVLVNLHRLLVQGFQQGGAGVPGVGGGGLPHLPQGPAEIHRRRAGGVELGGIRPEPGLEGGGVRLLDGPGQGIEAVGGADADSRGAPDPELLDGLHHFVHGPEADFPFLVGQEALVNDVQGLGGLVIADILSVGDGFQGNRHVERSFLLRRLYEFDSSIGRRFLQRPRPRGKSARTQSVRALFFKLREPPQRKSPPTSMARMTPSSLAYMSHFLA